jgi:glycolate dehydrogenase FAD-binding subunit
VGGALTVDDIREAVLCKVPLRIAGAGTWLDAGRPVAATHRRLALAELAGIIDYEPGDLTLTAYAGTTLGEIAAVTAAERQWLALDPPGLPAGTLGATVATASAGPLSHAFGLPRDAVLGVEAVTGDGRVIRGGGRVVKNVAGFDLTRLFVGSWGTLGVITEVTVRLRARPEVDETYLLPASALTSVQTQTHTQAQARLAPLAIELINAKLSRRLSLGDTDALLVRLGGNAAAVAAQREALAGDRVPDDVWTALRAVEPAGAPVWRCSTTPARFAALWAALPPDVMAHATPSRGVIRCIGGNPSQLTTSATLIGERLPPEAWSRLGPGRVHDRLSIGIKQKFDPAGILNPGILG